jgi:uncharacterized protein (DUF4213/DUF364 family)
MSRLYDIILTSIDDKPIEDLQIGEAYVGAKINNRVGVSHRIENQDISLYDYTKFKGKKVTELIYSNDPLENAIGTAAINAQIRPKKQNLKKGNIFHVILEMADKYDNIGIIGKFPIIDKLRQLNLEIFAFELKNIPGFLPAERAFKILPNCDLIIITGTAFVNKTLEHLLKLCNGYTLVVGPTTPLSDLLFDFGVDVLAGIICKDDRTLNIISQGGGTKEFKKYVDTVYISKK